MARVIVLMGSKSDLPHVQQITKALDALGVTSECRVASAHKTVKHLFDILDRLNAEEGPLVLIAVAGRSNALAGMLDANTPWPVITCPPVSSSFGGADIYSSLRMPSGVAPMVILDPEGAALAACKILATSDRTLRQKVENYQQAMREAVILADDELSSQQ